MPESAPARYEAKNFDGLTGSMIESFMRDGFLILENLISSDECIGLMKRMEQLVAAMDPSAEAAVFSTINHPHEKERYFFDSAREIRFFFEEDAFNGEGQLKGDFRYSINKVGHAMHDLDPVFDQFTRQEHFRTIAEGLGLAEPLLLQSMYIFKPPRIGGEVGYHQDATFLWTEPQSVLGLWLALEDATLENGCLQGIPGTHLEPSPRKRFRRREDGNSGEMEVLDPSDWSSESALPLEVTQGSVILLHGQCVHGSGPNLSDHSREAFSLHIIDGQCAYADDNWIKWEHDNRILGFDHA